MQSGGRSGGGRADRIFAAALDAVIVIGRDGRIRDWNPAAERTFGHTRDDVLGRSLGELIVPVRYRERHRRGIERYVRTGVSTILDHRLELAAMHADGHELPVELTVTEVQDEDGPVFVGWVRDLSAAHAAAAQRRGLERRLAFLAQAGAVLDRSLDLADTLERLARLPVPELCDLCVIDVADPDGTIRPAAIAAVVPEAADRVREVRQRHPLDPTGSHPVARVLRDRDAMLLAAMEQDYLEAIASDPEHGELMQTLRYRSAVVSPLITRGRVLGALSLIRTQGSAAYDEGDLTLAEELGRRAATAVDNARQYELTRHVAETLQRSLLPRSVPQIPGAELVVRYHAAGEAQSVGGDFYDAFALEGGRYGLVIGDVCGKGPEAAALTALARYTIRGAAGIETDPATVLEAVNAAVRLEQGPSGRFLTALFAIVEPHEDHIEATFACGGHPSPIVRRADGQAELVGAAGTLLGVLSEVELPVTRVRLAPGETLVCYTDGLTDAGAPARVLLENDLVGLIAGSPSPEPERIADLLELSALASGTLRDDMALLLLAAIPAATAPAAEPAERTHAP